jgi:hypothetical protein
MCLRLLCCLRLSTFLPLLLRLLRWRRLRFFWLLLLLLLLLLLPLPLYLGEQLPRCCLLPLFLCLCCCQRSLSRLQRTTTGQNFKSKALVTHM